MSPSAPQPMTALVPQRILIVSDVHSNQDALEAVLRDAEHYGPYELKLCAGDVVGYGPNPNEVIARLKQEGFITVMGNHDRVVKNKTFYEFGSLPREAAEYNARIITPESQAFLDGLSTRPYVDTLHRFAMVHGSFAGKEQPQSAWQGREKWTTVLVSLDDAYEEIYVNLEFDAQEAMLSLRFSDSMMPIRYKNIRLGIIGHTHMPMYGDGYVAYPTTVAKFTFTEYDKARSEKEGVLDLATKIVQVELGDAPPTAKAEKKWFPKVLFNPGSVGQPRHGSVAACYGVVEFRGEGIILEYHNTQYDVAETQRRMEQAHLHPSLIHRLSCGR